MSAVIVPAFLRIKDAAIYCSCSAEYIARCCRMGELAYIKKGRCLFFATADLSEWMRRDREPAKAA